MGAYGSPELPNRPAKLSRRKPAGLRRAFWRGFWMGTVNGVLMVVSLLALIILLSSNGAGR